MRRLIFAFAAISALSPAAFAQQQPSQPQQPTAICIPAAKAQAISLFFQQGMNLQQQLLEDASNNLTAKIAADAKTQQKIEDDATSVKAVAAAIAKQKAEDEAAAGKPVTETKPSP